MYLCEHHGQEVRMRATTALLIAAAVGCTAGCASKGQVATTAAAVEAVGADETVFVIGVAPARTRLAVSPGTVKDGKFHQDASAAAFQGNPERGFIVAKTTAAGKALAITGVHWVGPGELKLARPAFVACGGAVTMVFEAPTGKVVYLGDLEFDYADKKLSVKHMNDLAFARRFVEQNYPALKGRLEAQKFKVLPAAAECGATRRG
jgi:hypothetical protein